MRPPLSSAVKVSRFGFTEGSGWFELLALLQLSSEARAVSQPSPNSFPALLAFLPPTGKMGRVLESPPATMALGKAGRGRFLPWAPGLLVQPQWSVRLLRPGPLVGSNPGSPQPPFSPNPFPEGSPMPLPFSAACWPAEEEVPREASPQAAAGPGGQPQSLAPPSCPRPALGGEGQC